MRIVLAILLPLVLIGGGVGALYLTGRPPFARHRRAAAKPVPAPRAAAPAEPRSLAPQARRPAPRRRTAASTQDPADTARITRLASIYEQMPAEQAAPVFAKLPDPLVKDLLQRMDERQVAKLLGAFGPDRAARLTVALAR